eukprot:196452-Chlamydomonas_euryale.AAC.1
MPQGPSQLQTSLASAGPFQLQLGMASSAGTAQLQPGMDPSGAAQKQPEAKKEYLCGTCCVVLNV